MFKKPPKKIDAELFMLIEEKIRAKDYLFSPHAKQRKQERRILDTDVLNILEGKAGYGRTRNKRKDKYEVQQHIKKKPEDWRYCIEGKNIDEEKIRIIITFSEQMMLIVTVIRVK